MSVTGSVDGGEGRKGGHTYWRMGAQARIQEVGARAHAHPWGGVSPFKTHYSIAFKNQSVTGRPPLGEVLYPPLGHTLVDPLRVV